MINHKIVYKIIGSLLFIEAALMSGSLLVSLIYKEDDIFAFIVSIIITAFFGFIMKFMGRNAENRLSRRDSFLVVTLSWALFSLSARYPSSPADISTASPMPISRRCPASLRQAPPSSTM